MIANEALNTIIQCLSDRQLGTAIAHLETYLYTFQHPQALSQLAEVKADYERMSDYWQRGFDDPQRAQLFDQLLCRMYVLTQNVRLRYIINTSSYVKSIYTTARAKRTDWTVDALRREMESFVSDVTLLQLEPEHTRQSRQCTLYEQHQQLLAALFDYIWTSRLWTDGVASAFEDIILSPTIDVIDQQLLVSAITLSLMGVFGINKFRLLVNVYLKATDERVRQRALVGWVFSLDVGAARLYPEVRMLVSQATCDDRCLSELSELQMQVVYCLKAESDQQIIQSEIMPDLISSSNIRVTRNGIEEVDDDPMDDVLHPEKSEQRMERLEASMQRMADMQRQGSDVYFGGFRQMKRFPFFQTVANWLMPFTFDHPAISGLLSHVRGSRFLRTLLKNGPFCDSDKYSFVLGFQMAVSRMPEHLLELMDQGEATLVGGDVELSELSTPAFLRRSYLQSLYRFFRVYPQRSEFVNPFDATQLPRYLFMANPLVQQSRLEDKMGETVAFLLKHKRYDDARRVLQNCRTEVRGAQFYLLNGTLLMRTHADRNAGLTARESFQHLLQLQPDSERAWVGYARTAFADGDYQDAFDYYTRLAQRRPDRHSYQLNQAVCLTNLSQYDEALKLLYKLNYESPDDLDVSRVLAWTLVGAARYDQAAAIYQELLVADSPQADDLLNYGYCLWFSGRPAEAADHFKRYAQADGITFDAQKEFLHTEARLIRQHGVSEVEVRLMIDFLS